MINRFNVNQEYLSLLTSVLSKLMKQGFGKGPENCYISMRSELLTVYLRNFITPAEEVLIACNKMNLNNQFRHAVMDKVCQEFAQEARSLINLDLDAFYSDWDYGSNTGIILMENRNAGGNPTETGEIGQYIQEKLFEQITQLCVTAHKAPRKLTLIKLDQNIFVVECSGVIQHIENVLFNKGCWDLLYEHASEIKKNFIQHKNAFREVFGRIVEGMYMAWDYPNDRSFIFFYLKS